MRKLLVGAIADDFTGATDLANTLVRGGLRTIQLIGVPRPTDVVGDADAIVIALKTRTIDAADAVSQSLAALDWLRARHAQRIYFKICSTFDSTDQGNIGPVADALTDALASGAALVCPAFPATGRTVYRGHLFVGDQLLSDSPMRDHPLTPMRDANLARVLRRQTRYPVGVLRLELIERGAAEISAELSNLQRAGVRHVIADAIDERHLLALGDVCVAQPLVTAASGLAIGLAHALRGGGLLPDPIDSPPLPAVAGSAAILAGSCSAATRIQVEHFARSHPAFEIDPLHDDGAVLAVRVLEWLSTLDRDATPIVYSSAAPAKLADVQQRVGRERAAERVEHAFGAIARELVDRGVRRLVVAGGETSGAVVQALNVRALAIGPQIDPGVPWTTALGEPHLALALKSGNFGSEDFFEKALRMFASAQPLN